MTTWVTEKDLWDSRSQTGEQPGQAHLALPGLTLNVAFLHEIKQDSTQPHVVIRRLQKTMSRHEPVSPRLIVDELGWLRDELETHFALEEFYGYFESALLIDSQISAQASGLKSQHETIYLDLCELIELAESALYRETAMETAWPALAAGFRSFVQNFNEHEQSEQELMMRLCNEDVGVGD